MVDYHFALAWNWEHDADFVALLEAAGQSLGKPPFQVTSANLEEVLRSLQEGTLSFATLLDRASDSDERFLAVVVWARAHGVRRLNRYEAAQRAWDKTAMHHILGAALHTLPTITLPPYAEQSDLPFLDTSVLGERFAIKPAHGGGGEGVVLGATSLEQIQAARQGRPEERFLLQRHIVPEQITGRPAWFRVVYCLGHTFPCWWDTQTHVYTLVTPDEEDRHGLALLRTIATAIAQYCGLDLFSSEIALAPDGRLIVVDYVNDPLDLRLQSRTPEGVPDEIVQAIALQLLTGA
jgi:hypothetical protein